MYQPALKVDNKPLMQGKISWYEAYLKVAENDFNKDVMDRIISGSRLRPPSTQIEFEAMRALGYDDPYKQ